MPDRRGDGGAVPAVGGEADVAAAADLVQHGHQPTVPMLPRPAPAAVRWAAMEASATIRERARAAWFRMLPELAADAEERLGRAGENDGGYAVMDYRAVDPRLGTMADLAALGRALRERGMSLCVDLVLNHTAREHAWAQGWLAGDARYKDFYLGYPDREVPDAY